MNYAELRKINVNEHVEKKGNLSYLSWAWAVDYLLQQDPMSWWEFHEPQSFGTSVMVRCSVHAFGKTINMSLPVMDNRNNAVDDPDARKVSDAQMRCLAKAIACFGIGLYIYAGEDLPDDPEEAERKGKIEKLMKEIKQGNVHSKQHDAWVEVKKLCSQEEAAYLWGLIDSTTRRHIKAHGEALNNPDTQEVPLSQLIAA